MRRPSSNVGQCGSNETEFNLAPTLTVPSVQPNRDVLYVLSAYPGASSTTRVLEPYTTLPEPSLDV